MQLDAVLMRTIPAMALVVALLPSPANAADTPTYWKNNCASCHGNPVGIDKAATLPQDTRSLTRRILVDRAVDNPPLEDWLATPTAFRNHILNVNPQMTTLANLDADPDKNTELKLIQQYLIDVRDAEVQLTVPVAVVMPGQTGTGTLEIRNSRFLPLKFSVGFEGAAASDFSVSGCGTAGVSGTVPGANEPSPPNGIFAASICALTVSFTPPPDAMGDRSANMVVAFAGNEGGNPARRTISLTGARGAGLGVRNSLTTDVTSGDDVAFGSQNIGVTYARRITLRNVSNYESLAVAAPSFSPTSTGFELASPTVSNACLSLAAGITLRPEQSCVVDIRFAPGAVAAYASTLTLRSGPVGASAAPKDFTLDISGEGVDGRPVLQWQLSTAIGLAVSLVDMPGTNAVGSATPAQVRLTLSNLGPGAAALRLLNVVGTDASDFQVEPAGIVPCNFGSEAAPLFTSCEVTITFRPKTAGPKRASLQLVSTGTTPDPIEIRAEASDAVTIALGVTPASLNLDEVRVGAQSAPASVTLVNEGTVVAVVTSIEASPGFVFERGSCGSLPLSIAPRGSCTLAVRFVPGSTGSATGNLSLQVSGKATPIEVALQGNGTEKADVSGGGCSISDGRSLTDPTLWTLVLLAAMALVARHRRRERQHNGARR
jgi:hypothetical protein